MHPSHSITLGPAWFLVHGRLRGAARGSTDAWIPTFLRFAPSSLLAVDLNRASIDEGIVAHVPRLGSAC